MKYCKIPNLNVKNLIDICMRDTCIFIRKHKMLLKNDFFRNVYTSLIESEIQDIKSFTHDDSDSIREGIEMAYDSEIECNRETFEKYEKIAIATLKWIEYVNKEIDNIQ